MSTTAYCTSLRLFRLLPVLALCCLLWSGSPASAEEIEIDKESDGIHLIQKRTPRPLPEPPAAEQEPQMPQDQAGQGGVDDQPQEKVRTPKPEKSGALEDNPEYVKALNSLTSEYERRINNLQRESDRRLTNHNRRIEELRRRVLNMEQAMSVAEQNYERDRFYQLRDRRLMLLRQINDAESQWTDTRQQLRREEQKIDDWFARRKRELEREFRNK